jgi:hypothetical protein
VCHGFVSNPVFPALVKLMGKCRIKFGRNGNRVLSVRYAMEEMAILIDNEARSAPKIRRTLIEIGCNRHVAFGQYLRPLIESAHPPPKSRHFRRIVSCVKIPKRSIISRMLRRDL